MKQRTIRLAATGSRIAVGAAIAAACVVGVTGAAAAPWPTVQTEPAYSTVAPVPGDTVLVCNGSFRALGRDSMRAELMISAAAPQVRVDAAAAQPESADLAMPELEGGTGARVLTGVVQGRTAPQFAAVESVTLDDEDLRGLAAAPCREPSTRSWLVGGDVSTGASDVIVLSNPGDVPATVQLDVYGEARAASTVIVPAKTQMGVPLASVASGQQHPVVEVNAEGAPVRATLQSGLVRTLEPVGIDIQDGVGGAQNSHTLVGVQVAPITEGDDATGAVVRLLAPEADTEATVRVRAVGTTSVLDEYTVPLVTGTPVEIALTGLSDGAYDVQVDAAAPVVAAARQMVRSGAVADFAWMTPAPQIAAPTMFSVPGDDPATLYLRNTSDEGVTITLEGQGGRRLQLGAGGSASLPVSAGGYTLTPSGPVHAAIGIRGADDEAIVAGWPLWASAATQQPIVVRR
ncbi:DUF5719 family protein [Microbacterium sp.]|uniref:DUF5719 family protein n=1 Tax=Microbacterium sp. TaxID=51671 RepID=UPI002810B575|nr:DUF5719 family protein [Microbacterium sp.]